MVRFLFDHSNEIVVEIRAGEGGQDSKMFVEDMAAMYARWAQHCGLTAEVLSDDVGHFILKFSGRGAGRRFVAESGKHCVQRVPPTERSGRRQTSFIVVAVLPMPPRNESRDLPESEFIVKTQCGKQGAGGQAVNKTASAVRMTHKATGIMVFINGRSQEQNKQEARRILTARVRQLEQEKIHGDYAAKRREQLGDGKRGDKIRTYNFIESRVVDHRTGAKTSDIKSVMKGRLDLIQ